MTDHFDDDKFYWYELGRIIDEYTSENPNYEQSQRSRLELLVVRQDGLQAGQHPPWVYEDAMHRANELYEQWEQNLLEGFQLEARQNVERRQRRFTIESWGIHPSVLSEYFRAYQTDTGYRMPLQAMYQPGFIEYMIRRLGKRHLDERAAENLEERVADLSRGVKRPKL